jgi:nitronate monooxygenase
MAGSQDSALALAVCEAGGLGSLPAAMLSLDALAQELAVLKAQACGPYNVNFFCHTPPVPDATREQHWRAALAPHYARVGLPTDVAAGG